MPLILHPDDPTKLLLASPTELAGHVDCCCDEVLFCDACIDDECIEGGLTVSRTYEIELSGFTGTEAFFNDTYEVEFCEPLACDLTNLGCILSGCRWQIDFTGESGGQIRVGFGIDCSGDPCCIRLIGWAVLVPSGGGGLVRRNFTYAAGTLCAAPLADITNLDAGLPITLQRNEVSLNCATVSAPIGQTAAQMQIRNVA